MKKYIFTESQIKKVVATVIKEGQLTSAPQPGMPATGTLQTAEYFGGEREFINKVRRLTTPFVIISVGTGTTGNIAGVPIDKNIINKRFYANSKISLSPNGLIQFGIPGKTDAEGNGFIFRNVDNRLTLEFNWD